MARIALTRADHQANRQGRMSAQQRHVLQRQRLGSLAGRDEPHTPREQRALELVAAWLYNREIADQRVLSVNTIKLYTSRLYKKLVVNRLTEAVARARELDRIGTIQKPHERKQPSALGFADLDPGSSEIQQQGG